MKQNLEYLLEVEFMPRLVNLPLKELFLPHSPEREKINVILM